MTRGRPVRRARLLTLVGLALYAAVLIVSPFEHHDLLCHLKNPQHCTSCTSSQLGSDPHPLAAPGVLSLNDAGSTTILDQILEGALLVARTTGRSPPHAA